MHLFGVVCDIFFFLLLFFKVRSREPRQSGGRWIRAIQAFFRSSIRISIFTWNRWDRGEINRWKRAFDYSRTVSEACTSSFYFRQAIGNEAIIPQQRDKRDAEELRYACVRMCVYIYKGGGIDGGKKSVNLIVRSFLISLEMSTREQVVRTTR